MNVLPVLMSRQSGKSQLPKGGGALSQSKSLSPLCEDINIAGILSWCQVATRGAATLPQQEKNKSEDSQRSRKTFDHVQR
jgi:hypothetical protein